MSMMFICFSQGTVRADTTIKEMTDSTNYKDINWGVTASNPRTVNWQSDSFANGAFWRLTNGHSQYIGGISLAQSQNMYCVEPSRQFAAGPYSKGDGGVHEGTYYDEPVLGWIYSSRIK